MLRKELTNYFDLRLALGNLYMNHEKQKARVCLLLDELYKIRARLKKELGKTSRLSRHMTIMQKKQSGFLPESAEEYRFWERNEILLKPLLKPELSLIQIYGFQDDIKNTREIKAAEIKVITMIDEVKKKQLRLELLGMRIGELLVSINKAIEAYRHQWKQIYWTIYPLGIISILYKGIRKLLGAHYFTVRDLNGISVIGNLAGSIMKMANAPLI